jgi:hypothetical protein
MQVSYIIIISTLVFRYLKKIILTRTNIKTTAPQNNITLNVLDIFGIFIIKMYLVFIVFVYKSMYESHEN